MVTCNKLEEMHKSMLDALYEIERANYPERIEEIDVVKVTPSSFFTLHKLLGIPPFCKADKIAHVYGRTPGPKNDIFHTVIHNAETGEILFEHSFEGVNPNRLYFDAAKRDRKRFQNNYYRAVKTLQTLNMEDYMPTHGYGEM